MFLQILLLGLGLGDSDAVTISNLPIGSINCVLNGHRFATLKDLDFTIDCMGAYDLADPTVVVAAISYEVTCDGEVISSKGMRSGNVNEFDGTQQTYATTETASFSLGKMTGDDPLDLKISENGFHNIVVTITQTTDAGTMTAEWEGETKTIPGALSLLPAIVVFFFVIVTRQVLVAMPMAIFIGSLMMSEKWNPVEAFRQVWDKYYVGELGHDTGFYPTHPYIIAFTLFLGGMVGIMNESGGTQGLANFIARKVKSSLSAMAGAFFIGLAIFFDDYSDCLISGNTMAPLMDRYHVSREKFAFIIDATAAPIASVAPLSSWISYEISLIKDNYIESSLIDWASEDREKPDAYAIFIETIPYRFYPIMMLWFMAVSIFMRWDFGPMLDAEKRARIQGKVARDGAGGAKGIQSLDGDLDLKKFQPRAILAVFPLLTVILMTAAAYALTGWYTIKDDPDYENTVQSVFEKGDAFSSLLYATVLGNMIAILLSMCFARRLENNKRMTFQECIDALFRGMGHFMQPVFGILVFAWGLSKVIDDLNGGAYIQNALGDKIDVKILPFLSFTISGLIALVTGTSWGTMGTMFPYMMPLVIATSGNDRHAVNAVIGTILAGSVWGDHCSPISDTTVLSSLAAKCDHNDHVNTQLPYAIFVAFFSSVLGDLAVGYIGTDKPWAGYAIGVPIMTLFMFLVSTKVPSYKENGAPITERDFDPGCFGCLFDRICPEKCRGEGLESDSKNVPLNDDVEMISAQPDDAGDSGNQAASSPRGGDTDM